MTQCLDNFLGGMLLHSVIDIPLYLCYNRPPLRLLSIIGYSVYTGMIASSVYQAYNQVKTREDVRSVVSTFAGVATAVIVIHLL